MYGRLYLLWNPVSSIVWNVDINNYDLASTVCHM